jgi:Cu2+-containing amine oxidase
MLYTAVTPDEYVECERVVKADPAFRKAMEKRGGASVAAVLTRPSLFVLRRVVRQYCGHIQSPFTWLFFA